MSPADQIAASRAEVKKKVEELIRAHYQETGERIETLTAQVVWIGEVMQGAGSCVKMQVKEY